MENLKSALVVSKDKNYYLNKLINCNSYASYRIITKDKTPSLIFNQVLVDNRLYEKLKEEEGIIYLVEYLDIYNNVIYVNLGKTNDLNNLPYVRPCKHVKIGTGEKSKQDKTAVNTDKIKSVLNLVSARITLLDKLEYKASNYIELLENNYINTITFNTDLIVVNQSSASSSQTDTDLTNKIDMGFIEIAKKYPQTKEILYPLL